MSSTETVTDFILEEPPEISRVRNPLAREIERRIQEKGPMPFDEYMDIWNNGASTPEEVTYLGFYNSHATTIGSYEGLYAEGEYDFDTFPEISPIYGFLMAKQIAEMWERMNRDPDFQIVEMGGGNGTMAHDIVRGLRYFAPDLDLKYTIVEQSPVLAEKQRVRLSELGVNVIEGSALDCLPEDVTGVFISNELLDDLPAKILRKTPEGWEELYVVNRDENNFKLEWGDPGSQALDYVSQYLGDAELGEYPVSLAGASWAKAMSDSLRRGFVITVDYYNMKDVNKFGPIASDGRAVVSSETGEVDLMFKENIGKANITSSPDFKAFARVGKSLGIDVVGDVTVGGYLFRLGLLEHVNQIELLGDDQREAILGKRRLDSYLARTRLRTSSQRVLIQAKGINLGEQLTGTMYRFYDGITEKEIFYRQRFEPVD